MKSPKERTKKTKLDEASVKEAYRRWARVYDKSFGSITVKGRKQAVKLVNSLPGKDVLEVGVGTGLALPLYAEDKEVVGIDLSTDMLEHARKRVKHYNLYNVKALHERNAEHTGFEDNSFDIAVAMFVASVVPDPEQLFKEMKRIVRPGGHILCINHFQAEKGPRKWVEQGMARASRALGWHPDFAIERLMKEEDIEKCTLKPVSPLGLFTLLQYKNHK